MRRLQRSHGVPKRIRPQRELLALRAKLERAAKDDRRRKRSKGKGKGKRR